MTTLLAFLFTLAVLIVFHEFGHYWVARRMGVKVLRFSVGFGQVIASRTDRHGTEWALSAIPLGGYVKMLDEREGDVATDQLDQAFNRKSVGARAAIVAAGPLANLLLAVLLFWGIFMAGVTVLKPIIGEPDQGSPAHLAGMHASEIISTLDGEAVASWQDLHWLVLKKVLRGEDITLETVDSRGYVAYRTLPAPAPSDEVQQAPLQALGLTRYLPPVPPVLGEIAADGVAAKAGLTQGDRILSIDGVPMQTWEEVVRTVRASADRGLTMQVQRGNRQLEVSLTPARVQQGNQTIGRIGAGPRVDPVVIEKLHREVEYSPLDALQRAFARTWELSAFSLEMLGRMLTGEASIKNLSGPITIADYAGQSAAMGLESFLAFLALVSVSLGVLNLLPVPILDGGHLLYHLAEFLTGRPISERVQEIGQKIGASLLGLLMFFALFNDLSRLFSG